MKLVTFNIRCDYGQDGENCFVYRKPLILEKIAKERPDVICFQEVLPHVAKWLKEELQDYYVIGCGRDADLRGEQVSIAYRKENMNLMRMESYWLSKTPYVPGSRYEEQSECPRICTEAVFEDLESRKVFRLVNTHLDHIGMQARKLGYLQILTKLEQEDFFPEAPVVIVGDMNAEPDSEEMRVAEQFAGYVTATKDIGITFHGYGKEHPCNIDYIVVKGCGCDSVEKWTDKVGAVSLSDHYPVCARISFA